MVQCNLSFIEKKIKTVTYSKQLGGNQSLSKLLRLKFVGEKVGRGGGRQAVSQIQYMVSAAGSQVKTLRKLAP